MKPRHKRLAMVAGGVVALAVAAELVLNAFQSNLVFFFSPSQVAAHEAPKDRAFRIGGLVEEGSVQRPAGSATISFRVTDGAHTLPVTYRGVLPDLFREGQGVIAEGTLGADGTFVAREVLAKHDENYMPPEAQAAVKQAHNGKPIGASTLQGGTSK